LGNSANFEQFLLPPHKPGMWGHLTDQSYYCISRGLSNDLLLIELPVVIDGFGLKTI
jgi:hypothetical protein